MIRYGYRLIFNEETGYILNGCLGEMMGDLPDNFRPEKINFVDLPFGYNENNFKDAIEYHIDITKDKNVTELKDLIIIDKYIEHIETEEEKLRREKEELENQLLLEKDKELGGIL